MGQVGRSKEVTVLPINPASERYSRQILFRGIGIEGQKRILASSAVVVGCGAIGAAAAQLLARAGVGRLRVIDRDFVEPSNLQRQALFDEADARESLPKATAGERKLRQLNAEIAIEGVVADLTSSNAVELLEGFELILDGTDNFETRRLLNECAVRAEKPWIYAAAVGSYGLTFTIRPGSTACLACLLDSREGGGRIEDTCDTAGILGPAVGVIASLQVADALKILSGNVGLLKNRLQSVDVWQGRMQSIAVARLPGCEVCGLNQFRYLHGQCQPHITLCGRDSVQIHERRRTLDLALLEQRLSAAGVTARSNGLLLRFQISPYEMTVFQDGRAILKGSSDPAVARSLYARFIGA